MENLETLRAKSLSVTTLPDVRILGVAQGRSKTDAKTVVAPMQRLHGLRTEVKGHATTEKKKKAEIDARTKHGSFRSHFTQLAGDCDKAFNEMLSAFGIVFET